MRNMDPMKKDRKERDCFAKYLSIVDEMEDEQFNDEESVRESIHQRYKGAKKDNSAQSVWRKYKTELTGLWTFAKKKFQELVTWQSYQVDQHSSGTQRSHWWESSGKRSIQ